MGKLAATGAVLLGLMAFAPATMGAEGPITRSEARGAVYHWWHGKPRRPEIQWQTDIGADRAIVTLRVPFASPDGCIYGIDRYRVAVVRRGAGFWVSAMGQRMSGTIDIVCALGGGRHAVRRS